MDNADLIKALFISDTNSLGLFEIFLTFTLPFILCLFIALFYKTNAHNNHYSISFIISIPLFGALTSIITLLIGSNIARAFGLVGALSLIRFRTALKEPLDSIYLFWALAVGMATGTGFYMAACLIVLLGVTYMFVIYKLRFANSDKIFLILKVYFNKGIDSAEVRAFEKRAMTFFSELIPMNIYAKKGDSPDQYVYSARLRKRVGTEKLAQDLKSMEKVEDVEFISQDAALYT